MQIGIANGIPLNNVITGDDLVPAYDQSTGTEGYVNLTTAVQKAFSGSVAGTANGVLYLDGSKVATSGSALTFDGANLGIGTSSPNAKLHISGPGAYNAEIRIDATSTSADSRATIRLKSSSSTYGGGLFLSNGTDTAYPANTLALFTFDEQPLAFGTANSERMRLDSSGNLGLGVTPSAWGSSSRALQVFTYSALYDFSSGYNGLAGNARHDGSTWKYITTNRAISYEQSVTEGNHKWYTAPSGTAGNAISFTQAMTLDASGNLLVGTTTNNLGKISVQSSSTKDGISVESNTTSITGQINFRNPNGYVGAIISSGTSTAYNTSSDYRLKNVTGPVTNSGTYIDSLNPVEGTWKADGSTFVGLIAHEVQEVSRTSIATGVKDGEEMQAMDYSNSELIANLIAEVKSLRARVAALEA